MFKNKILLGIIGFYIIWLGIMPFIATKMAVLVCKKYSYSSPYNIDLDSFKVHTFITPNLFVSANKISITSKDKNIALEVKDFKLNMRILPLISGKIHINDILLNKFNFVTMLQEQMELDKEFISKIKSARVKLDSITCNEFEVFLYQKNIPTPISYKGKDFSFQMKNRYLKFVLDSVININNKKSNACFNLFLPKNNNLKKTKFDVNISNFELSPLRLYLKHYLPEDLKELNGVINIKANKGELLTELRECSFIRDDYAKSIIFPSTMLIKSKFNIKQNYINFENVDIESKNIHASFSGRILDYFGKTMPTLDINLRLNKSRLEDIISFLPPINIEELNIYKLKQYKFYGDTLANISIKGRLPEPDVYGDIYIDNGILINKIPNTPKGATIKLDLLGKYIYFDVIVPAGGNEKVWVKGSQELYNIKYADFTVKSSPAVNLHNAQSVVNPLHEILNFIIGPVPIMEIFGQGNIDIQVKGNRKNPHIWGVFNLNDLVTYLKDIPDLKINNAKAVLNFEDQNVKINTMGAKLNGKDFNLNGHCSLLGDFTFELNSQNQPSNILYKSLKSSELIDNVVKFIPQLNILNGLVDFDMTLFGNVRNIEDIRFNENTFLKGNIILKDNIFEQQEVLLEKINGLISVDVKSINAKISALFGQSPLDIDLKVRNLMADMVLTIPKLNPNLLIKKSDFNERIYLPFVSLKAEYNGEIDKINLEKLKIVADVIESYPKSSLRCKSGSIKLISNKLTVKNIKGYIDNINNSFVLDLFVSKVFSQNPEVNGTIKIKTPNLSSFNNVFKSDILPIKARKLTKDYQFTKGKLDLNCKIINNKMSSYLDVSGISFVYLPTELPVDIINGTLLLRNNSMKLNKINMLADNMPILVDGDIKDFGDKTNFNLYFNSKPRQDFIDKYINKNQIYPIKIKGDIVYWARLKGSPLNYDLKTKIDMSKDSSVYHFGATVGDIENAIAIYLDTKVLNKNNFKIKEFTYDKLIDSQSGKKTKLNMLRAWGGVEVFDEDLSFKDLWIKTSHPTDARIFNIIFRKPNIKQGQFTSDLKINGRLSDVKVLGDFHIFETNIPFLDTTMKNIILVFKDKNIEFNSQGDILGNEVTFNGVLKNKLTVPYKIEKAFLYTKDLDLNRIVNKIKLSEMEDVSTFDSFEGFKLNTIIANNFVLRADNIQLRNLKATDFEAVTSLSEKEVFDVNNFKFNIAQGVLRGKFKYDFKTNDMGINLDADSISANDISWALFDLKNQIYGDLTGNVSLSCNGLDFNYCMQTLSGETKFKVLDGRLPKLGSLEYLLKASNLVKGGITGLSINSVIDLVTPLKIGEFSEINGQVRIKDGIARNIEILTKGKDLNLFIDGNYNFANSNAEMQVLGFLSKKISTVFGPIGNVSINTLFNVIPGVDLSKDSIILEKINKIPGIELTSKAYRKFVADIKGNINEEDYVKSFKWIN